MRMKAMVMEGTGPVTREGQPLHLREMDIPVPGHGEVQVKVHVCGVCHTELDEIEGRTPPERFPRVPGHQVVGTISALGEGVQRRRKGERVGVAWIFGACGHCEFCRAGMENLCPDFEATGRDADGGYAEYMVVHEDYCYPIPEALTDAEAAPLLCAGAIGYRSFRLTGLVDGGILGLTGFGGSGHLVLKMVKGKYPNARVFVFARNPEERAFAREIGADWAGDTDERPPELLDAMIDTTPAWKPIVSALKFLKPGGRLVVNAIRKEAGDQDQLTLMDYATHLWLEKEIKSVANVTRRDVSEFLQLAADIGLKPDYQLFPLEHANDALKEIKFQKIRGAKILRIYD